MGSNSSIEGTYNCVSIVSKCVNDILQIASEIQGVLESDVVQHMYASTMSILVLCYWMCSVNMVVTF